MPQVQQMYVMVGKNQPQKQLIKTIGGTALNNKYFVLFAPNGTKYAVWFDTGTGVAPTLDPSWTLIDVVILAADTAAQVATKLKTELALITEFAGTTSSANEVTVLCATTGICQAARDIDTLFSFEVLQNGMTEKSIGCVQGDIEVSPFEYTSLEVKCHASGSAVVQEIVTGFSNPTISFTLQETSKAKLEELFNIMGNTSSTGIVADNSKVFGFGTELLGKAKPFIPVRLHPVAKDTNDLSEDWNFWKTNLTIDSFTFAAEDVATCGVSFKAFQDSTIHKSHNVIMIGNAAHAIPA